MSDVRRRIKDLIVRIEKTDKLKIQNEVIRDQTIATLKKKFDVDNYDDAMDLLENKQAKQKKLIKKLEKSVDAFEEEFDEYLAEIGV